MKKTIFLSIMVLATYAFPTITKATETVAVTFKFVTINTIDGFDHLSKLIVYCDDKKVSESSQKIQSESNKIIVPIPAGYHTIRATLYALHEGNWEARLKSNDYSFDFEYAKTKNWESNHTINLTFDIEDEMINIVEKILEKPVITPTTQTGNYTDALKKLNTYLKTFDNGYYGYFEIIGNDIYMRFKAGKYNKFKAADMQGAVIQEEYKRVIFKCKGDNKCISTDWNENGKEEYSQFTTGNAYNYQELKNLLDNFLASVKGNLPNPSGSSTTNTTNSSVSDKEKNAAAIRAQKDKERNQNTSSTNLNQKYTVPLKKLNEYLKTFNSETYRDIEVKDGKVYFAFAVYTMIYKSDIDINELKQNTITVKAADEVKIGCKNEGKCFYSTYSKGNADHFRFFSKTVKDLTIMKQLVDDFIKAL